MTFQRYLATKVLFLCAILTIAGCGRTKVAPVATRPAPTSESAGITYVVQRGRVVKKLEFEGQISPVEQVQLYFRAPGYVKKVYVKPGDQVRAGDLLAELETEDLLNEIAQAETSLESAQLLLSEAEKSLEKQTTLAELNLAAAQAKLTQAKEANAYAITQADLSLSLAQEQLVRLTQTEQANTYAIAQARLSLSLAREQLTRILSLQTTYTAGIVRARVGLEQAEDQVARAETEYKEALDRPWEPQDARDAYEHALQQAQWKLEIAQTQYDQAVANMKVYQSDLKIQEIVVKQAEAETEHLKEDTDSLMESYQSDLKIQEIVVKQTEAEMEQLKKGIDPLLAFEVQRTQIELDWLKEGLDPVQVNEVNQAQLALEQLQGQLAYAQIVAPIDGKVLSLSLYPGRPVEAFREVIIIGDPSAIEVRADLSPGQLKDLTEGQKTTVALSTDPERTWTGDICYLPYPYNTENPASADRLLHISLEGHSSDFKIGDLAQVTIVLEEKDNTLWLPAAAIRSFQGRKFVILQDNEGQRRIDVELGIESQDQVEILKGLEEGQVVAVP